MRQLNETLERRVAERTLQVRESEERFRALVDASAQIVWTTDSKGRVVEDSPSLREFTGRSFDECRGWGRLYAESEYRVRHHSGEWYWMQMRAVPLFDDNGAVRGWVGMNIDIHERKQAEADRERLTRSLVMAEQEERRRISQVLHDDLQQLLYATQMRITLVAQGLQSAGHSSLTEEIEEARVWLRQCVETTRQMTVDLSPPILKNEGLADALEWLQPQMEQRHGLNVVINAESNFRIADADLRVLLFQIVRELLFNVAKHAGVDRVLVNLRRVNEQLVIQVIDEGRGFAVMEVAERKQQKGGFGLFSVQDRLRLIGGRVDIYSRPGAGTHIVIHAPI
jgi:signal transduction histidine kinase